MICGPLMTSVPLVGRRGPAADIDCQDRGCILIENHSVVPYTKAIAGAIPKSFHIAVAGHGITM